MDRSDLWRTMLRIRRLEEAVVTLAEDDHLIRGHTHVSIGQEATAVAAAAALAPDDYLFTTHRNHGHVLARGGEPVRILAEILGRVDGYSGGRAGSFHVSAPALGILHTSAIVAGCIPLAAGAAFAAKRQRTPKVALALFGDGAMEEGAFSETMNIAQLWRLPVVFLMENNSVSPAERSGRGSPTSEHSASALSDVPRAYGIATVSVDGADAEAIVAATCQAVDEARTGNGPCFIESRTSRWPGNYGSAPTLSVGGSTDIGWVWAPETAPDPLRRWIEQSDPLLLCARALLASGEVDRARLVDIDRKVCEEMRGAVEAAKRSPEPAAERAFDFELAP